MNDIIFTAMQIGGYEINIPFVTTSSEHVKTIIELANITQGQKIIDLGSGDGRMVIAFAKAGGNVDGFEFKPHLAEKSRRRITDAKLQETATIYEKSFWDVDLSSYDIIYIYGMQSIMERLEEKLFRELHPGAKFISNIFRLPRWKIKKSKDGVHLYIK